MSCGRIGFDAGPMSSDAGPGPCPLHIADPAPPFWLAQGTFAAVADPAGSGGQVWVSTGLVPFAASFILPFKVNDRLIGLEFDAYGDGGGGGLTQLEAIYLPDYAPNRQISSTGEDIGRKAQWGKVSLPDLQSVVLTGGSVEMHFNVTERGYYIGMVTPIIERPCTNP